MNLLAGALKPRSCRRMKLTTQPGRGLGSLFDAGGTIHAGRGPSSARVSYPPFTNSSNDSWVTVDRGHMKGSST
jgi:hypothetical protein